ncbi:aminotransferase class V-fold PLP-dependent enzyme [Phytohabitans kaempferiae]|uniref:Aminotransferase class V-fold PLP-dependent enzyme n=1 Tax=Phytohabitans kaempferiae TaxID=1620943 RepID=A0ABV6MAV2_9ACTN
MTTDDRLNILSERMSDTSTCRQGHVGGHHHHAGARARRNGTLGVERVVAAEVPAAVPVSLFGAEHERVGIVSVAPPGHDVAEDAQRLALEHGVGVRAEQFCAHPLARRLTGSVAPGGDDRGAGPAALLRISFCLGTVAEDIDRVVEQLHLAALGDGLSVAGSALAA